MDTTARSNAQALWNASPCGAVEGDPDSLDYFLKVERERYDQQSWQKTYFRYQDFAGKNVLELGIGHGTDLAQFAKAGAVCSGLDITDRHLALTARNFTLRGLHVDLHKGDATAMPFADASFDCVYSFGVVHHIPEIEKVVSEIRRVLKPGGIAMIAVYHKWSGFWLVAKLLVGGILGGRLARMGMDGLKATIETGADGIVIKPYVRLYSRGDLRRLFVQFKILDISAFQFHLGHILPLNLRKELDWLNLPMAGLFGWYVTIKAQKPAD